jgi:hypothetical protein
VAEALDLGQVRALLDLDEEALVERAGVGPDTVEREVRYEKLEDVDAVEGPGVPGTVFLRGGRPELVYLRGQAVAGWTPAALRAELGEPEKQLRSRAGKAYTQFVYPDAGVAYAAQGDDLAYVEVFRPRSLADYERDIYREPRAFIR